MWITYSIAWTKTYFRYWTNTPPPYHYSNVIMGLDSVSNHQPHNCLLNRLFRRRSKKTSKLRVTGLCVGNSPVTGEFPAQMASNAENVSIWWRHHCECDAENWLVMTGAVWLNIPPGCQWLLKVSWLVISVDGGYIMVPKGCHYVYTMATTLIASFMGPTWGLPGADRTQVGPMWAKWTLLSEYGNAIWLLIQLISPASLLLCPLAV